MGLAAAMDVSIAIDTAKFGFPEVRIGVAPALISVLCIPKMRSAEAASAMLRGNRFLAPEAQRIGIINSAVPADHLDAEVDSVVRDLMAGGPDAIAHTKKLLSRVPDMEYDEAIDWAKELSAELFKTDEAKEGMTAYLEKRPASWVPQEGTAVTDSKTPEHGLSAHDAENDQRNQNILIYVNGEIVPRSQAMVSCMTPGS